MRNRLMADDTNLKSGIGESERSFPRRRIFRSWSGTERAGSLHSLRMNTRTRLCQGPVDRRAATCVQTDRNMRHCDAVTLLYGHVRRRVERVRLVSHRVALRCIALRCVALRRGRDDGEAQARVS